MVGRFEIEQDDGSDAGAHPTRPAGSNRRRRVAIAAVAVAVAGVWLARMVWPSSTARPASGDQVRATLAVPSSASRPGSASSVIGPAPVATTGSAVMTLGGPLLPTRTNMELVARTGDAIVYIGLDDGVVRRRSVPAINSTAPVFFLAGRDWVLERSLDNVTGYLIRAGEPPRALSGALENGTFGAFRGDGPTRVWILQRADGNARGSIVAVDVIDETTIGAPILLNGLEALVGDGAGQVLLTGPDGVYVTAGDRVQRVTAGSVVAVNATLLVTDECDDSGRCGVQVIDRRSGARRVLPRPATPRTAPGVVSPDGRFASYRSNNQVRLIDLTTGADTPVGYTNGTAPRVWSPDSRYLLYVADEGRITVFDTTTSQTRALHETLRAADLTAPEP